MGEFSGISKPQFAVRSSKKGFNELRTTNDELRIQSPENKIFISMFTIINKQILGKEIKRLDIEAPQIARSFQPGQFVMVCSEQGGKWIPLTIVESDTRRGIISIIFKETGAATRLLGTLPIQDEIFAVSGPFGTIRKPTQVGVVVCVTTGVAAAQILPVCRAYSRAGNKVIGVLGAGTKSGLILEPQMRIACHRVVFTTEDGSYQRRGKAASAVKELLEKEDVHLVYSAGDVEMMRDVAQMTARKDIPNLIQVQTVISCGRGICGSCRVKVDHQMMLTCEDGPEFDGHKMDYEYLKHRMDHVCRHDGEHAGAVRKTGGFLKKLFEG